ncbi:MAG: hypothetical protein K6L81_13840 [Agarilytica sp.]
MKTLLFSMFIMVFGSLAMADTHVNSKESMRLCKSAMEADLADGTSYKFKRKTATSVEIDRFKHWINFLEISEAEKSSKKLLCETSRSGEVLVLQVKPGKWKI